MPSTKPKTWSSRNLNQRLLWIASSTASTSPLLRRHSTALGEPPRDPAGSRVSSLLLVAGGRRRPRTVDLDLIRRPGAPHTPSASRATDWPSPPVSAAGLYSRELPNWNGPAQCCAAQACLNPARISFFWKPF
jgi:hypothetical protein